VRLAVVADTHLRGGIETLSQPVLDTLRRSDAILHAGDVVSLAALEGFRSLAPLHAVLGNNDQELHGVLAEALELELGGVRIAMVHDSGPSRGRPARMARRFPDAQVVVFGHSHVPANEMGVGEQVLFNPGSPTQRRAQPRATFGIVRVEAGAIVERTIVPA
jgi:uncharacterized protein